MYTWKFEKKTTFLYCSLWIGNYRLIESYCLFSLFFLCISVRFHQLLVTHVLLMHTLTIVFCVASNETCVGNKCYVVVLKYVDQRTAYAECRKLSYDSLASVADNSEQKALYTLLNTRWQYNSFWIGAEFQNLSGWQWLNGQPYYSGTQESLYFTCMYW
jgi:Lectin C-type domain